MSTDTVKSRHKDRDDKVKRIYDPNLILDTRLYNIMFPDCSTQVYAANVLAESMNNHLDSDGYMTHIIEEITDHEKDASAITTDDNYITSRNGNHSIRKTTKGWSLLAK